MNERQDRPLEVEGAEHFVERNYREGGRFQWVRETLVNAIEAGATRVEYGTEWQGVEHGVWRRTIADNGTGMTPDDLQEFFRVYGGSGKTIGGPHDNFGIGAKCSLFPWNTAGVVVVSWHSDYEEPAMIWVRKDPRTGRYGLRTFDTEDGGTNIIYPDKDDELTIDVSLVKPKWIDDHGTVVLLLGNRLDEHTILGDPSREEGGVPGRGIAEYLNRRIWDLGDVDVKVDEYATDNPAGWPLRSVTQHDGQTLRSMRTIRGAQYFIEYPPAATGRLAHSGTVPLQDGTEIDWYLWKGDGREGIRGAAKKGFIAATYTPADNRTVPELFDVEDHHSRFRQFGISERDVRQRLWLIARPPLTTEGGTAST